MILVSLIVALLLCYFVSPLKQIRNLSWLASYAAYLQTYGQKIPNWQGTTGVVTIMALPLLVLLGMQWSISDSLYGLAQMLFGVLVIAYCWGPDDIDQDVADYVDAMVDSNNEKRRQIAVRLIRGKLPDSVKELDELMSTQLFAVARRRWFGVIFWFCVLGPAGALLFRMTHELSHPCRHPMGMSDGQLRKIRYFSLLLDWPVSVGMGLSLAIASHFDLVVHIWKVFYQTNSAAFRRLDSGFIDEIGRKVLDVMVSDDGEVVSPDNSVERLMHAKNLLLRMVFIWLTILAMLTLTI